MFSWVCRALPLLGVTVTPAAERTESVPFTVVQHQLCAPLDSGIPVSANPVRSVFYGRNQDMISELRVTRGGASSALDAKAPDRAAPDYDVTQWTTADGLPADKLSALCQSRDGYLWVGTAGGLVRFDGVRFVPFPRLATPENPTNHIVARAILEDVDGRLWVGTRGEVLRLEGGVFASVPWQGAASESRVNGFAIRSAGGFWLATDSGVEFWDGTQLRHLETPDLQTPFCLEEDGRGALWIGSRGGLYRYDLRRRQIDLRLHRDGLHGRPDRDSRIFGLRFDALGRLWIGASHGALDDPGAFDVRSPALLGDSAPAAFVFPLNTRLARGWKEAMWVVPQDSGGLLYRYALVNRSDGAAVHAIESGARDVRAVVEDREGAVWLGGRNGLFRIRRRSCASLTLQLERGPMVFNAIGVGRDGTMALSAESISGFWAGRHLELFETGSVVGSRGLAVGQDSAATLWSSLLEGGLVSLGNRTPRGLEFSCDLRPIAPEVGRVLGFHPARDQRIWILSDVGLFLWDGTSAQRMGPAELVAPTSLDEDETGRIWVGTRNGLLFRALSQETFQPVPMALTPEQGGILSVLGDGNDSAWLGTEQGLVRYHQGNLRVPDPDATRLPRGAVDTLMRDPQGRLWLGHAQGLACVTSSPGNDTADGWLPESRYEVSHFGRREGVIDVEPSLGWPRGAQTPDGRLWFARRTALVMVDPADLPSREAAPRVFIEKVAGSAVAGAREGPWVLPPGSGDDLSIDFTSTSLFAPERGRLEYRLEGHDTSWLDAAMERSVTYDGLPPGDYRFRVRTRNHTGRWSESEATLALRLLPHYWQTTGFRWGTTGVALVAMVGGVQWWTTRQRRRWERRHREVVDHERRRIAQDLHDRLGARLSETTLRRNEPQQPPGQRPEVLRDLAEIIWEIHPENDTLASLGDFIVEFSSQYLGRAGIEVRLEVPLDLPEFRLPARLRTDVSAMFQEVLRNIVQHSEATRVDVRFSSEDKALSLDVADNGCGVPAIGSDAATVRQRTTALGGGQGLRNLHARCQSWGGECRVLPLDSGGTIVRIRLPLTRPRS